MKVRCLRVCERAEVCVSLQNLQGLNLKVKSITQERYGRKGTFLPPLSLELAVLLTRVQAALPRTKVAT